jgi:hypothetical protein
LVPCLTTPLFLGEFLPCDLCDRLLPLLSHQQEDSTRRQEHAVNCSKGAISFVQGFVLPSIEALFLPERMCPLAARRWRAFQIGCSGAADLKHDMVCRQVHVLQNCRNSQFANNNLTESAVVQDVESRGTHAQRVLENFVEVSAEEAEQAASASSSSDDELADVPDLVPGPEWGNPCPVNVRGG